MVVSVGRYCFLGVRNPMGETDNRSVVLCHLKEESEALLLGNFLEEAGIPHMFDSYHSTPYDSIFQFGEGFAGEMRVVEGDLDRARRVLRDFNSWLATNAFNNGSSNFS